MTVDEFARTYFRDKYLYHFTDVRNLPSILATGGLLPWAELKRRGIEVLAPGGNDWSHDADARYGMDAYVHLCFIDNHPMEYVARKNGHIEQTRFLKISPEILQTPGLKFSPGVSNKADVPIFDLEHALSEMKPDFDIILNKHDFKDPAVQARLQPARKYELLVPDIVPAKLIRNL
jgi:hypothetical protein